MWLGELAGAAAGEVDTHDSVYETSVAGRLLCSAI
jgi:hypothetical protein